MTAVLLDLIRQAKTFGSVSCSSGIHTWVSDGGRSYPKDWHDCSQTVYVCGVVDYGDEFLPKGSGRVECFEVCRREFCVEE